MGLAESAISTERSLLNNLEPIRAEFKEMAAQVFNDVIASLGNIQVNPVPSMDHNYISNNFR